FSDKDELAAAVVQFVVEDLGPALGRALGSPGSTNERLAAYISTHIDYCRAESTRAAAIIAAVGYLSRPTAAASQGQPHGSQEPSASQDQSYSQRSAIPSPISWPCSKRVSGADRCAASIRPRWLCPCARSSTRPYPPTLASRRTRSSRCSTTPHEPRRLHHDLEFPHHRS